MEGCAGLQSQRPEESLVGVDSSESGARERIGALRGLLQALSSILRGETDPMNSFFLMGRWIGPRPFIRTRQCLEGIMNSSGESSHLSEKVPKGAC